MSICQQAIGMKGKMDTVILLIFLKYLKPSSIQVEPFHIIL
jgi:hypothetical protein